MESRYFKRDISWLSFNYRVLLEAEDDTLPLYERMDTEKIDTDALTPDQIAEIIANRIRKGEKNT